MLKNLSLLLSFFIISDFAFSQNQDLPNAFAFKLEEPITLDGILDEEIWKGTEGWSENFTQYFPYDTLPAIAQSKVKIAYDGQNLYLAAVMYNLEDERKYVSTSLRRDYRGEQNDGVTFVFDTFNDNTNAFQFGINPYGVQREGLLSNGGQQGTDLSLAWDNKWYAKATRHKGYWIAEAIIPLSTLRFQDGGQNWNVNFYRIDSEYNERSSWSPIPRNFSIISLAFMRKLIFQEPLEKNSSNISLIPYISGNTSKNFIEGTSEKFSPNFGGDAKIGLSPSLNLDLTFNPDFSQVEVDEQVTNLDRFEIFFPERRQFFLENADLFSDFGTDRVRPFFSRRIGVDRDENTGQNVQNPIIYGARLSGKLTDNFRVGLLNMQTATDDSRGIIGRNYTVAAIQKKVFARSNIGLIFIDRETLAPENNAIFEKDGFSRVVGVDYNLASADNKWNGKFFYHHSFEADQPDSAFTYSAQLNYNDLHWSIGARLTEIGANYNPEVGFTPRTNLKTVNPRIEYRFFPESNFINTHGPQLETEVFWNEFYGTTDVRYNLDYNFRFQSLSRFSVGVNREYVYLFNEFDPTRTGGEPLPANTDYWVTTFTARFTGNPRNIFNYQVRSEIGEYFTGNIFRLSGELSYRLGYLANISMNFSYNNLQLPGPQTSAQLFLIGPRFDITFTDQLFWTTFIQYNNQIDNLNINTRFQWRFAPVSDLFIVYTDNYFPESFLPKQRSFAIKLNYWLNL